MENSELKWTTDHTADNQMIHDFGNGYTIVVDKSINMAYKMSGDKVKDCFSTKGLLLEPYIQILRNFAKSVQQ